MSTVTNRQSSSLSQNTIKPSDNIPGSVQDDVLMNKAGVCSFSMLDELVAIGPYLSAMS
jgi:hypothetical protein